MFRIDDPSAAVALPTPEAAGTEGYWTEGNPGLGIPATLERASWFNMIQEELRAIVIAGGGTPSKTTYNQVLAALNALYISLAAGDARYLKLTGGSVSGTVAAAAFSGPLTGNVTGNVSGSSGSCTGNAATASTASACSGNAATSSACTGNAATASSVGANSMATSGYQKLPSGMIFQWGYVAANVPASFTITFPIAFLSAITYMAGTYSTTSTNVYPPTFVPSGLGAMNCYDPAYTGAPVYWFAIGY